MKPVSPEDALLNRNNAFSDFWVQIVRTRLLLVITVSAFASLDPGFHNARLILRYFLPAYIALNVFLGLIPSEFLQLKRMRLIPDIIDIIFISFLVYFTGGPESSWFLIYLFPIISASRYFGPEGSIPLTLLSLVFYAVANMAATEMHRIDFFSLALKALSFLGIGLVAGNLARTRKIEEKKLLGVIKEIDNAILSNRETEGTLKLILSKGMEFTGSDRGDIRLVDKKTGKVKTETVIGTPIHLEWEGGFFDKSLSGEVLHSGKSKFFPNFRETSLREYFRLRGLNPKSAMCAPLLLEDDTIGTINVGSSKTINYTRRELGILEVFARFVVLAIKNAELISDIKASAEIRAEERKERLKMLNAIASQLRSTKGPKGLFNSIVSLALSSLDSEEAALFLVGEESQGRIKKVAVSGPNDETTVILQSDDESYASGDSYTGSVFKLREIKIENKLPDDVKYGDFYRRVLPSRAARHYLGVPLVMGNEIFGVLRVINKKSPRYSLAKDNFELSDAGFDEEDVELMQIIACQVAATIQNANLLKKYIEAESYFKNLIIDSPDPIIVINEKGNIKIFNRACQTLWGCSFDYAKDKPVGEFYESWDEARSIRNLLKNAKDHRIENHEARIRDLKSNIIPISLSASLLSDANGNETDSIGVFKDLRETKRLQSLVVQSEKLATVEMLARTVIHDMKHDIGTALLYLDALIFKCDKEKEPDLHKVYTNIKDALWSCIEDLNDVLIAGKPRPLEKRAVSVEHILKLHEEQMRRQSSTRRVEFTLKYPEQACELMADVGQLRRVLWNLFHNSVSAIEEKRGSNSTSEAGRIEVSASAHNNHLELSWSDNGCGIAEEDIARIFEPFFTGKKSNSGTGLGLHIVKYIVENHGGQVLVESKPGIGTCFKITLPILKNYEQESHNHQDDN